MNSYTFTRYNILPLEAPDASDVILEVPEVKSARLALEYTELQVPRDFRSPRHPKWDVFDALEFAFGFQHDNVRNQREHLVLLIANAQSQLADTDFLRATQQEVDERELTKLCNKILDNYEKWCSYIGQKSVYDERTLTKKVKVALVALYLCIWGEAANVRFLPECICYIYHHMAQELAAMLDNNFIGHSGSCKGENGQSFLKQIITPLYHALSVEAGKSKKGKAAHYKWRNYDDFNEFFWSPSCFKELRWPMKQTSPFFPDAAMSKDHSPTQGIFQGQKKRSLGKTSFVEHRTFFRLYHSFLRAWILLIMMFQGLTILAYTKSFNFESIKILLSLGPTYFVMKLIESILDIILMVGAYTNTRGNAIVRIFAQFLFFGGCTGGLVYLYLKMILEGDSSSFFFKIYLCVLGSYVVLQLLISLTLHVPSLRTQSEKSDTSKYVEAMKWLYQERYFVGRGLFEWPRDYIRYVLFWVTVLGCKFTFSYFLQIKPLVDPTLVITSSTIQITYTWHDFVSKNNHNAFAVFFLWAPVFLIYLLDISIWYAVFSAILGGLLGARDRLGEIRSLDMFRNRFESFPEGFVKRLQHEKQTRIPSRESEGPTKALIFAPFWNEIITCLREEDYLTNSEKELLVMPVKKTELGLIQWPLFLLVNKVFLAMDMAMEKKDTPQELWDKLKKDQYMISSIKEVFESVKVLLNFVENDRRKFFDRVYERARDCNPSSFFMDFQINNIQNVATKISALARVLVKSNPSPTEVTSAVQDVHEAVYFFVSKKLREEYRPDVPEIPKNKLPTAEEKETIKRLNFLLTINKDSAATVPKNLEARRRLEFFTNSLFMNMPFPPTVRAMKSFSVFTPYFKEIVLYSTQELYEENEDGISTLFYLQKIFPDEWDNFLKRNQLIEAFEKNLQFGTRGSEKIELELRLWASYRGQTLARTVRGMMYYRRALILQSFHETSDSGSSLGSGASEESRHANAKAFANLKFTYVITCQVYGQQKASQDLKEKSKADDILYLMNKNEGLRIAFIDTVHSEDGKGEKEYFSKLVKGDKGKDQEIYSIKLPGDPILGEGKPENQNHAVIFTRGVALQTIDMNQDNYFEEALKMRNLLMEFEADHGIHSPTILGVRENVFTGSVSSLAWFMSNQETSFVTLGQRVLARPLKVRMHYGHPDVFDRIFHLTRGGFSKASKVINISEDIYAGFNSTLRQGNVTHHEYIQVGKGRDVGLNQIATFEAKVSSGNGEQSLSRDVYRLGQLFDFFRMLSFYVTSVGYYVCTMMTVLVVYVFLYGKAYMALSGVGKYLLMDLPNNKALQSALDTQFLFQIGFLTAIPMLMGFILEQGVLKAIVSFITMQLQLCSVFFTFSLGTRTHYFGRTILHGGAKYRETGRGFVVQHIKFADNYRMYSRSHFVKALEIAMLLLVYLAYGSSSSYFLFSFSCWFLAISWLFAPFIFNPSGFEWQKTVDDFNDWTNWLFYRGGVGVKANDSWETWWEEEQEHIQSQIGRVLETILSLRFFLFQYGVVYHLNAANGNTSLTVYGISWLVLVGIILISKVFSSRSFSPKVSEMFLRLVQCIAFIMIIAGLVVTVALTQVTWVDIFASLLALIPTGWGILSIGIAWKSLVDKLNLWSSFRAIARFYDAAMGMVIFFPIAILSWFPFVSTFQTRLLFNQAFSRGLEISLILAGNRPNVQV